MPPHIMTKLDDFDPTRVLDGWCVPAPSAVDLDIGHYLDTGRVAVDAAKKARLEARGFAMNDIEDVDPIVPRRRPS